MNKAVFGFNVGVKFYVYRAVFLDFTYGSVGVSDSGVLLGPSILTGADLFFSRKVGMNIAGGMSYYRKEFAPTLDIGLLLRRPNPKPKNHRPNNYLAGFFVCGIELILKQDEENKLLLFFVLIISLSFMLKII